MRVEFTFSLVKLRSPDHIRAMCVDGLHDKAEPESAAGIDAELLGSLSALLSSVTSLRPLLGNLVKFDLVVDANIIGADLRYLVEHPEARRTRLQEIAASGLFQLHIPHWALSELEYSTLDQIETIHAVSKSKMQDRLDTYLESFEIHESYKWPAVSVLPNVDGKDEPYAALARDINASAILSRDTDIEDYGAIRLDIDELIIARLYARTKAAALSMQLAGISLTGLSLWSVVKFASYFWRRAKELPVPLQLALGTGIAIALTSEEARKIGRDLKPVALDAYSALCRAVDYANENDNQATQKLSEFKAKLGDV